MFSFKQHLLIEREVEATSKIAKFFKKKGFKILDFGYMDESQSKMTVGEAMVFLKKEGFKLFKKNKTFGDFNLIFHRTPGPYQDETLTISTKTEATKATMIYFIHHSGATVDKT